ncbi:MAG: hypothetical protein KF901_03365 [Myxococcales bacterium]|nr:hypothetical protein [Myxococcales bacterium]
MRVPARFDGRAATLWLVAGVLAAALAWCDARGRTVRRHPPPATDAGLEFLDLAEIEVMYGLDPADAGAPEP